VAQQSVTTVAPEIAAGFTETQVKAFHRILGKHFTTSDINILGNSVPVTAGTGSIFSAINSGPAWQATLKHELYFRI
jgi:hypothetical protein